MTGILPVDALNLVADLVQSINDHSNFLMTKPFFDLLQRPILLYGFEILLSRRERWKYSGSQLFFPSPLPGLECTIFCPVHLGSIQSTDPIASGSSVQVFLPRTLWLPMPGLGWSLE